MATPHFGKVIGTPSRDTVSEIVPEPLAPCLCGEDAVWYRPDRERTRITGEYGEGTRGSAVANMDVNDFSLCPGCFLSAVPETEQHLWVQVTSEEANVAAKARFNRLPLNRRGPDSQECSGDPFAPPPLPDDW